MKDENNFYETICKDRFDRHDEKIDDLMVTVKNGLSHRVKRIDRLMWLMMSIVVAKFITEFFV